MKLHINAVPSRSSRSSRPTSPASQPHHLRELYVVQSSPPGRCFSLAYECRDGMQKRQTQPRAVHTVQRTAGGKGAYHARVDPQSWTRKKSLPYVPIGLVTAQDKGTNFHGSHRRTCATMATTERKMSKRGRITSKIYIQRAMRVTSEMPPSQ